MYFKCLLSLVSCMLWWSVISLSFDFLQHIYVVLLALIYLRF